MGAEPSVELPPVILSTGCHTSSIQIACTTNKVRITVKKGTFHDGTPTTDASGRHPLNHD